jgi:hypothetical protein
MNLQKINTFMNGLKVAINMKDNGIKRDKNMVSGHKHTSNRKKSMLENGLMI